MVFRKDINGLRAIAVLAVVFYHFNVPFFSGGFVGVDIFFVISGFLMTGIIFNRISDNKFSLIGFYLDRARRIIPALSFLCIAVFILGWFILIPVDFENLGKHIAGSITFISNVLYYKEVNYFDVSSIEKWLLHTWSLSVEWQFYIIYPAVVLVLKRLLSLKTIKLLVVLSLICSFIASVLLSKSNPSSSFYLLHTRAWEMLAGGVIFLFPPSLSLLQTRFAKLTGLLLIVLSILFLDTSDVWPGYLALIPVVGTCIVIAAKDVNTIFTDNVISQFIGKISYSVYLWHWPIVVYLTYSLLKGSLYSVSGILVSLLLGSLSFYFIENPLRKLLKNKSGSIMKELSFILPVCLMPFLVGCYTVKHDGVPERYPFSLITSEELASERARYWVDGDKLKPVPKNGEKKIVIIGNSHGIDLTYSLTESGLRGDITYLRTTSSCSNFGYTPNTPENSSLCNKAWGDIMKFSGWGKADLVILHDDWAVENINGLNVALSTIRKKTNADIYVFGPKMMFKASPSMITKEAMENKKSTVGMINDYSRNYYFENRVSINNDLVELFKNKYKDDGVFYINSILIQCGEETQCDIISPDSKKFLYFDPGHFTLAGAQDFGEKLRAAHPELYQ